MKSVLIKREMWTGLLRNRSQMKACWSLCSWNQCSSVWQSYQQDVWMIDKEVNSLEIHFQTDLGERTYWESWQWLQVIAKRHLWGRWTDGNREPTQGRSQTIRSKLPWDLRRDSCLNSRSSNVILKLFLLSYLLLSYFFISFCVSFLKFITLVQLWA